MPRTKSELLTSVELEFMKALWSLGQGSVREVMASLSDQGRRAYTSVATVLRILDEKGYVTTETRGRALVYRPVVSRGDYEARSLRSLSRNLFGGTPSALVARLVDDEDLDEAEMGAILRVIEERIGRSDG